MKKTADNKYNLTKVEGMAAVIDAKLNHEEVGHLIDALYWKHKIMLSKTFSLIQKDIEAMA